jgi:acetyl-CoA carboxylase biotin carboxylase subunit
MAEHPELRQCMGEAALRIARAANYSNAGTMEFLVDNDRNFYFLEMNTRLQVEHPVTELVTGLDLVQWQLRIAAGEALTLRQEDVRWSGSAIECRIYAEDPDNQFLPSPGQITRLTEPAGPGVRLDSGVYEGWTVPLDYDPLLAKLAAWAPSRDAAIERMKRALSEYMIAGIRTNRAFFSEIMDDAEFRAGKLSTAFLDQFFERRQAHEPALEAEAVAALAATLARRKRNTARSTAPTSRWLETGRETLLR